MLGILNIAFFIGHTLLIVFNLTGWIWRRTRKLHLLSIGATLFSWLIMGAWKGWGYCLCTDWHFQIRRQMGIHGHETSYTELLLNQLPGVTVSHRLANHLTLGGLVLAVLAAAAVWLQDYYSRRANNVTEREPAPSESNLPEKDDGSSAF